MKKSKIIVFISLVLSVLFIIPVISVSATFTPVERNVTSFEDEVGIVSEAQAEKLREYLDAKAKKYGYEIAVAIVGSTNGKGIVSFADDLYDYSGYGYGENDDGILLVINMGNRQWAMATHAKGLKAFNGENSYALTYVEEAFFDDLSSGNYYSAFIKYADACDEVITYYEQHGKPMKAPFAVFKWMIIGLIVGFIIALIVTGSMKAKLKSVQMQDSAQSYIRPGSMNLTQARDYFIYRTVTRTARPKDSGHSSGGHTSSSGRSHGGSHGSF